MFTLRIWAIAAMALVASAFAFCASAQNTLNGTYVVAGKAATVAHVGTYKGSPQSGKAVTVLVFSAKDQAKSANPANDALFGQLGDAIVVKLFDDGKVYSADLVHQAFDLPNNTMTLMGGPTIKDFKKDGGAISGELVSTGDARGQKWDVDLTFKASLP